MPTINGTALQLLTAVSAVNGEPDVNTDVNALRLGLDNLRHPNEGAIYVVNTSAGAGDSILIRLWVKAVGVAGDLWYPHGVAGAGVTNIQKGTINGGLAITVNGAPINSATHREIITDLRNFSAIYAEVLAGVVGTWDAFLQTRDPGNRGPGLVN